MFTGIDLIVILFAFFALFYASGKSTESEFTLEPLTLLVVAIVAGMVAISVLGR